MEYQKGDILRLSERGLYLLYEAKPKQREKASRWRFQFRCYTSGQFNCLTVLKLPYVNSYYTYHQSFLELASPIPHSIAPRACQAVIRGFKGLVGRLLWFG